MNPLPFPVRIAAGLLATAVEQARDLPRLVIEFPVTAVSQALQASMRVQQRVTELAIKGDRVLGTLRPVEEKPSWATFDEDESTSHNGASTVTELRPLARPPFIDDEIDAEIDAEIGTAIDEEIDEEIARQLDQEAAEEFDEVLDDELDAEADEQAAEEAAEEFAEEIAAELDEDSTLTIDEDAAALADLAEPDLASSDLTDHDLATADLAGPDLAEPDLTGLDLTEPDLTGPDLAGPDLGRPDFGGLGVGVPGVGPVVDGPEPSALPSYPHLTIPQLRGRLRFLAVEDLRALLAWEMAHGDRPPYVTMLTNRITTVLEG